MRGPAAPWPRPHRPRPHRHRPIRPRPPVPTQRSAGRTPPPASPAPGSPAHPARSERTPRSSARPVSGGRGGRGEPGASGGEGAGERRAGALCGPRGRSRARFPPPLPAVAFRSARDRCEEGGRGGSGAGVAGPSGTPRPRPQRGSPRSSPRCSASGIRLAAAVNRPLRGFTERQGKAAYGTPREPLGGRAAAPPQLVMREHLHPRKPARRAVGIPAPPARRAAGSPAPPEPARTPCCGHPRTL